MRNVLVTPPTSEPVTIAEAKHHLGVTDDDNDSYIAGLIVAARTWCEMYSRQAFMTQTWKTILFRWPAYEVELPKPPLVSVTHVKYYDDSGVQQTWNSANYVVDTGLKPGRVIWAHDITLPPIRTTGVANPIEIQFVCGFAAAELVPQAYKHAMLLLVGHWMDRREEVMSSSVSGQIVPMAARALLSSCMHGDYP